MPHGTKKIGGIHIYLSELNINISRLTDLAKKRRGSADLHTPMHPPLYSRHSCILRSKLTLLPWYIGGAEWQWTLGFHFKDDITIIIFNNICFLSR